MPFYETCGYATWSLNYKPTSKCELQFNSADVESLIRRFPSELISMLVSIAEGIAAQHSSSIIQLLE